MLIPPEGEKGLQFSDEAARAREQARSAEAISSVREGDDIADFPSPGQSRGNRLDALPEGGLSLPLPTYQDIF
jgi:hypothetical protein